MSTSGKSRSQWPSQEVDDRLMPVPAEGDRMGLNARSDPQFVLARIHVMEKPRLAEQLVGPDGTPASPGDCVCNSVCTCVPVNTCACDQVCVCDTVMSRGCGPDDTRCLPDDVCVPFNPCAFCVCDFIYFDPRRDGGPERCGHPPGGPAGDVIMGA